MKILKKCPLCGEPVAPDNNILCTNCGNILTEGDLFDMQENVNTHVLPDGTVLQHRYEIRRFLGQGGFGITYECFDTHQRVLSQGPGRKAHLNVLRRDGDIKRRLAEL